MGANITPTGTTVSSQVPPTGVPAAPGGPTQPPHRTGNAGLDQRESAMAHRLATRDATVSSRVTSFAAAHPDSAAAARGALATYQAATQAAKSSFTTQRAAIRAQEQSQRAALTTKDGGTLSAADKTALQAQLKTDRQSEKSDIKQYRTSVKAARTALHAVMHPLRQEAHSTKTAPAQAQAQLPGQTTDASKQP